MVGSQAVKRCRISDCEGTQLVLVVGLGLGLGLVPLTLVTVHVKHLGLEIFLAKLVRGGADGLLILGQDLFERERVFPVVARKV